MCQLEYIAGVKLKLFEMVAMARTAKISSRIEPELKIKGDQILSAIGLSPSDAISMFYRQIVMHRGLPFEAKIPNKETIAALKENLSQTTRYASVDDLMADLNSDD